MVEATARSTLHIQTRGLSGTRSVLVRDGEEVATLKASHWRTRADLTIDEASFLLERESMVGRFVMRAGDRVLASAEKPSVLRRDFRIRLGEAQFDLRSVGWLGRRYVLEADGKEVGSITKTSWWRTHAEVQLPAEWPLPLQAFVAWLAWNLWRQEARATAAGS